TGRVRARSAAASCLPAWTTTVTREALIGPAAHEPDHRVMHRRSFLTGALSFLAAPLAAEVQQSARIYRIGYLGPGSGSELPPALDQHDSYHHGQERRSGRHRVGREPRAPRR